MSAPREIAIVSRDDCEVIKQVLKLGDFERVPYEGTECLVTLADVTFADDSGSCEVDKDSKYFSPGFDGRIVIGQADYYLDYALDLVLRNTCCGEICKVVKTYKNSSGTIKKKVTYTLHVLEVSDEELLSDWPWDRLLATAQRSKDQGVALVKEKRIIDGFLQFSKALKMLIAIEPYNSVQIPEESLKEIKQLKGKLYNNLAHCQLHYEEYEAAQILCNKALEYEPDNVKALYRRCCCYMGQKLWEEAYDDIVRVLKFNSENKSAQQKANFLKSKVKKLNDNYNDVIKKMFS